MSVFAPAAHPALPGEALPLRLGVGAGVLLLHVVLIAWILFARPSLPAPAGEVLMVSFVSAPAAESAATDAVPPAPPPPPQVQQAKTPPVLATQRQTESAPAAPQPVAEPAAEAAPVPAPAAEVAAPAAAAPAASGAPAASFSPPQFGAAYLNNPRPHYPLAARRLRETGVTRLRVVVSAEGRPVAIEIDKSSGSPRLDTAAMQAVRDWKFVPAREGERAVQGTVLVPIHWKLEN